MINALQLQQGQAQPFCRPIGREEAIAVVLEPDVAAVFATSKEVNQALRVLIGALGSLAETPVLLEKVKSGVSAASSQS